MEASTRRRSKVVRAYSRESRRGDLNGRAGAAQRRAISFSSASRGFHVVLLTCSASEVRCPEPQRHQYINASPGIWLTVRYLSLSLVSSILTVTLFTQDLNFHVCRRIVFPSPRPSTSPSPAPSLADTNSHQCMDVSSSTNTR